MRVGSITAHKSVTVEPTAAICISEELREKANRQPALIYYHTHSPPEPMAKAASDDQQVEDGSLNTDDISPSTEQPPNDLKTFKSQRQTNDEPAKSAKRRCISTACLACRRRKSKVGHASYLSLNALAATHPCRLTLALL